MSNVAVFGAGYVGLVTGACFAELGHDVAVRDVVPEKIDALRRGDVPIFEPGLDELLERNADRLRFTLDVAEALDGAEFLFICVGTPPTYSGDADLSAVWTVLDELPQDTRATVVMKSTVPVGTGEKVRGFLDARGLPHVGYVSNPEFTAEGTAVRDFMQPDRIVVGSFDDDDAAAVEKLHEGIVAPVVRADVNSAEMIKLASNAFLMARISFINEIANVCEVTGADVTKVAEGIGHDKRLGPHFLRAGIGYGGSCLDGRETVLVRLAGRTWLTTLERLFEEVPEGAPLEVLSWRGSEPEFLPAEAVTRRRYTGDVFDVRTKMGRRVTATADHPFVTRDGTKLASELTADDWLPLAQGAPPSTGAPKQLDVTAGLAFAGLDAADVVVRVPSEELAAVGSEGMRARLPDSTPMRRHDIRRTRAMRLPELDALGISRRRASAGTARNGTYVPLAIKPDAEFLRVAGLYAAEGHCTADGRRMRLYWSFHPRDENDLVEDVLRFWRWKGVKTDVDFRSTSASVRVSSRVLAGWWLGTIGLGANCYEQRVPDLLWNETVEHKRAFLGGLWHGDGSWSLVAGGPSVVLEYGTVSRALADGVLRLLGELGIVARMKVGRTAKSTVDTYWLTISGADQVERLLDLVSAESAARIRESIAHQAKRTLPTGYRRDDRGTAWLRIAAVERRSYDGYVYSLEVPDAHTFVTTGGLVVHNCFPKDSLALKQLASNSGYHFMLLSAVIEVNELQKRRVIQKLQRHLGKLRGKTVALLGLAFKPHTDDTREAPSLVLASRLLAEGVQVRGWDPVANPGIEGVTLCSTPLEAVTDADAAVIVTEWPELAAIANEETRAAMRHPLILDGRNLLDPAQARAAGFAYEGIGRAASLTDVLPETPERDREARA